MCVCTRAGAWDRNTPAHDADRPLPPVHTGSGGGGRWSRGATNGGPHTAAPRPTTGRGGPRCCGSHGAPQGLGTKGGVAAQHRPSRAAGRRGATGEDRPEPAPADLAPSPASSRFVPVSLPPCGHTLDRGLNANVHRWNAHAHSVAIKKIRGAPLRARVVGPERGHSDRCGVRIPWTTRFGSGWAHSYTARG